MFILLHNANKNDNREICVNVNKITSIEKYTHGGTVISFDYNNYFIASESYDRVLHLLQTVLQQGAFKGV